MWFAVVQLIAMAIHITNRFVNVSNAGTPGIGVATKTCRGPRKRCVTNPKKRPPGNRGPKLFPGFSGLGQIRPSGLH